MITEELFISVRDFARLAPLAAGLDLAEELSRATVVPEERMPGDIVRMHSHVTYLDETSGERREVELVFPDEADLARGRVSVLAPVGSALLGLRENQAIDWPFPDGRPRRLRVARTVSPTAATSGEGGWRRE
jgi:regulator of nucleoside diphosphate kinase